MSDILFYELIRVALGNQSHLSKTPSESEWEELYNTSRKQSLIGICFAGVQTVIQDSFQKDEGSKSHGMPEYLYLKWMGMAAKIQQRNLLLNQRCKDLQTRLAYDGQKSCILKGQSVCKLYSDRLSLLRQPGDIDVWIDGSRDDTIAYVQTISPTDEIRWLHARFNLFTDTEVEVHFSPSYMKCPSSNNILQSFFDSERNYCFAHGEATQKMNEVFILSHAYRHLTNEGVGLRQLLDYYFVLCQRSKLDATKKISCIEFAQLMKTLGMWRFAKGVMWIMFEIFGLKKECLLCEISEEDGNFLLSEVMKAGNFGRNDDRNIHKATESALHRFCRLSINSFRVFPVAYKEVLWSPIWRVKHWIWRRRNRYR